MNTIELKILNKNITIPQYKTSGAAGIDLQAAIDNTVTVFPGTHELIPSGIAVSIDNPEIAGYLLSRSGFGLKNVRLGNCTGLIDSDYQGEIGIILFNDSDEPFEVKPMERIAQLVFAPVLRPNFLVVEEFSETSDRGTGGFGSTGK